MGFFDRLFGRKQSGSSAQTSSAPAVSSAARPQQPTQAPPQIPVPSPSADPAKDPNMIRAYDSYGREVFVTRQQWLDSVLMGNIEKAWNMPDQLASLIIGGLNDRFFAEMVKPAERLKQIDSNLERGTVVLAIVYMEVGRLGDARRVLQGFVQEHGERGVVLTNLAKIYDKQGDTGHAQETLWRALELDPNQDNGLAWYLAIQRERGGEAGYEEGLRRIAAVQGSWRAQLWQARVALGRKDLAAAVALYEQAIGNASTPLPADALMQITGDLGNHGYLEEIVRLAGPRFDVAAHGLQVGNNLIKAHVDLGHLDEAGRLVEQLHAADRPDWKPTLNFWDAEIAKKRLDVAPPVALTREAPIEVTLLTLEGPVWLDEKSPGRQLLPSHGDQGPWISFLGGTAEVVRSPSDHIRMQPSDGPGRLSRALPLFLAEQVHLLTQARARVLVPWIVKPRPGFVLSGIAWTDAEAAKYAAGAAFVVVTHVKATIEPWQVTMRLIRTADGVCMEQWDGSFDATVPTDSLRSLGTSLATAVQRQLGVGAPAEDSAYAVPDGRGFADYLLRLEQLLAARCGSMDGIEPAFFTGEHEALDGALRLCVNYPRMAMLRLLPILMLWYLRKQKPQLVAEYAGKLRDLHGQYPLDGLANTVVEGMIDKVLEWDGDAATG